MGYCYCHVFTLRILYTCVGIECDSPMNKETMAWIAILVCLTALAGTTAAYGKCPSKWFDVVMPVIIDTEVSITESSLDTDLVFFREVLKLSENELNQTTQDAIEFFNSRFGLDFSQSEIDPAGRRSFGNAILSPYDTKDRPMFLVINSWLINGRLGSN